MKQHDYLWLKWSREKLKLQIQENDIEAAHPLPRSNIDDPHVDEKPTTIQVKLARRDMRDEIISMRKQLKNSGTVILEDLTAMNMKLINRLKNHPLIKNQWSTNGKIYGVTPESGKKIRFELFDDIAQKIRNLKLK